MMISMISLCQCCTASTQSSQSPHPTSIVWVMAPSKPSTVSLKRPELAHLGFTFKINIVDVKLKGPITFHFHHKTREKSVHITQVWPPWSNL